MAIARILFAGAYTAAKAVASTNTAMISNKPTGADHATPKCSVIKRVQDRERNKEDTATYFAARGVVYGFLIIIALITIFNMLNSISMSVSARIKQYGAMRAVGMDDITLT